MAKAKRLYPKLEKVIKNFNIRSPDDARLIAEIEADEAAKKKAKGSAKDFAKELADAKKARKVPKFNSKGVSANKEEEKKKPAAKKKAVAKKKVVKKPEAKKPEAKKKVVAKKKPEAKKKVVKRTRKPVSKLLNSLKKGSKNGSLKPTVPQTPKEKLLQSLKDSRKSPEKPASTKPEAKKPEAKKPVAKALSAESKTSTNPKIRRKTVNTSRGKPPTKTKVDVRRTGGPKFGAGNKTATAKKTPPKTTPPKPKLLRGPSTIGPAGERIGGNPSSVKKGGKLASVGKNLLRFGPLAAVSAGSMLYNAVHPDEVKKRSGPSKAGFGTKKPKPTTAQAATSSVASTTDKKDTGKKKTTTTSSFGAAFRKAKDAGEKVFPWNGKSYSTATKDEVKKSGSKNLREHLNKQNKKKSK